MIDQWTAKTLRKSDPDAMAINCPISGWLLVNMDQVCDRNHNSVPVSVMIYEFSKLYQGRSICFIFEDGVNFELSGCRSLIEAMIQQLSLTAGTCLVIVNSDRLIEINNATVSVNNLWAVWANMTANVLREYPLAQGAVDTHFLAMCSRATPNRLRVMKFMHEQMRGVSRLSFNYDPADILPCLSGCTFGGKFVLTALADEIIWATATLPITLNLPMSANPAEKNCTYWEHSLSNMQELHGGYFMEIVTETDSNSNHFFTEKTMRNFALGTPFILAGAAGSLGFLRSQGFKTFSPYIDESYDLIQNDYLRLRAVQEEIRRISLLSLSDLTELRSSMRPVLQWNYDRIREI
jgi:hypothetical protein